MHLPNTYSFLIKEHLKYIYKYSQVAIDFIFQHLNSRRKRAIEADAFIAEYAKEVERLKKALIYLRASVLSKYYSISEEKFNLLFKTD